MPSRTRILATIVLAAAAAAACGCSRLDVLNRRLDAIADARARLLVRDLLWAGGSTYRWADHATLRAEVARIEHRPAGDTSADEVWLLDLWDGKFRIERPDGGEVAVFDGFFLRVFRGGKETVDLAARARAAADALLVRELLPMPLSLAAPGVDLSYAGARTGPGEARSWRQLLLSYGGRTGHAAGDRAVVEVLDGARRVDHVLVEWAELPWAGRPMRVDLLDWQETDGLLLSRLWRFIPIDETGQAAGPPRWTVRVKRAAFDAPAGGTAFARP